MKFAFGIAALLTSFAVSATPALKWANEQTMSVGYLGNHLAVDSSGAAFVTGGTYSGNSSGCMTTTKHAAADGAIAWKNEVCGLYGFGYGVALDSQQNPVVGGYLGTKMRVAKLSSATGAQVWEQQLARDTIAIGYSVTVLPNDDVILVGVSQSTTTRHTRVFKLRGSDGAILWEATTNNGSDDNYNASEVAPDGSVLVGTRSLVAAGIYRWAVMKYRPDGTLAWTKILTNAQGQPTAFAIDANGDVYAGGVLYVLNTQATDLYVYKFAAADGATLWERNYSTGNYNDYVTRMKLDGKGALYITGGVEGQFFTAKLATATGVPAWESKFTVAAFGDDAGLDIAFDPAGDVIVTGNTFYQSVQQARTIKYSAATGQRLWVRSDDSTRLGLGSNIVVKGTAIFLISSLGTPGAIVHLMRLDSAQTQADSNAHGLWWKSPAGAESGWGMNFSQQGEIVFMTWFTYDTDGSPLWFVVSSGNRGEGNIYSGKLFRTTGPAFNSVPFNPSQVGVTEVGTATFEFDNDSNGVFHFTLASTPNTRYTHPITRQVFATPLPACATTTGSRASNYQDLWWAAPAGVESGWGINLTHQQDIVFATWFTYGPDSKPMWLVGSDVRKVPGQGEKFAGKVYKTKGSAYNVVFDPSKFSIEEVGNMTLTFSGPNAGVFDYTVNGITQSKAITRQDFANPPTVCH